MIAASLKLDMLASQLAGWGSGHFIQERWSLLRLKDRKVQLDADLSGCPGKTR